MLLWKLLVDKDVSTVSALDFQLCSQLTCMKTATCCYIESEWQRETTGMLADILLSAKFLWGWKNILNSVSEHYRTQLCGHVLTSLT